MKRRAPLRLRCPTRRPTVQRPTPAALSTLAVLGVARIAEPDMTPARYTTLGFMTLALAQVLHAMSARSRDRFLFGRWSLGNPWVWGALGLCLALQLTAVSVPALQRLLHTVAPSARDWALIAAGAVSPMLVIEFVKLARKLLLREPRVA